MYHLQYVSYICMYDINELIENVSLVTQIRENVSNVIFDALTGKKRVIFDVVTRNG